MAAEEIRESHIKAERFDGALYALLLLLRPLAGKEAFSATIERRKGEDEVLVKYTFPDSV